IEQLTTMASSIDIAAIREAQRAQGPATILAIGTATPSNCVYQADYPDYYFRITKSEHMVDLKEKFKRMCGTVLRLAKDLAENNKGARVLVVCSEITAVTFRGPNDTHLDSMVGQALFGDGAAAVIVAHPGGPAILDQVELKLGLKEEKMRATRHVLSEYGNMSSACVLFILDEMRKKSAEDGATTTGEGLDWGVLFGFGPGLTVETVVLHSLPTSMPIAT
ncbi:hypothetical protein M8C21_028694, partial [Ambrosia artemisiifolia]